MTDVLQFAEDVKISTSQSRQKNAEIRGLRGKNRSANDGLSIKNLSIAFKRGEARLSALHDVSYTVARGETVGIVGESGSGKSITWLAALGLLPKSADVEGSVRLGNLELIKATKSELQNVRGRKIGMIFQDPVNSLNPVRKISSQLVEAIKLSRDIDTAGANAEALRLLDQVGIARARSIVRSYPHELSGGMSQRVMIAMSVAANPSFLIADEPTTALDVTTQAQILKLLDDIRRQMDMGLIFISHDLDVVANVCSRVVVMRQGRVVEDQPTRLLFERPVQGTTQRLINAMPKMANTSSQSLPSVSEEGTSENKGLQSGQKLPLVRFESVSKTYAIRDNGFRLPWHQRTEYHAAVQNVSLEIEPGTTFGLVGESGSGKSTIGQLALGVLSATMGSIQFDGKSIDNGDPGKSRELRRLIQLIPQDPFGALDRRWTIGAQIEEPLAIFGLEKVAFERKKQCLGIMERIGLEPGLYDRYPSQLSGGQRQRVVLARALISKPRFIVCDEVTSALDVSVQAQVLDLLRELQDQFGLTYLFITHDLRVVSRLAHRVAVLHQGRIVEVAAPSTLFERPAHPYTQKLVKAVPRVAIDNFGLDLAVAPSNAGESPFTGAVERSRLVTDQSMPREIEGTGK
ncbi:dipeptide ABC transporter ATP-binding protein [Rhizobium leguminosarum]|uniref:dipeptide ABC transporter ATP-binding protein n=1 Tax=Rhizobium leguminosarum TaxID=384 RepID=UPI001C988F0C|nr:ABC transporter ATP-binding protein [Rhizobium leguminosarum]MBY5361908.1 ABC transporter ATP-binding protein [Rhizobium leguminosarum]MBY5664938.1 ABC transporter ATP-binding protein [Rhizobium leguminosarum]MBY5677578.1 ABC transporter ATP-binding protein [Rhizobium leguminosarum]